jgi:hypothetical protein
MKVGFDVELSKGEKKYLERGRMREDGRRLAQL